MIEKRRPILIFPHVAATLRSKLSPGRQSVKFPSSGRQVERLGKSFEALTKIFDSQNTSLSQNLSAIEPEKVLVLETIGSVDDLMKAIRKIDGLEWLIEGDSDKIEPDNDFCWEKSGKNNKLEKKLYLIMANRKGIDQFISLWNQYKKDPKAKMPYGVGKLKNVFSQQHV